MPANVVPPKPPVAVRIVYCVEGAKVPPAATRTPPLVNVAVPPTESLLFVPSPLAVTWKIEFVAKFTLPVTVKVPTAVPATAPGANLPLFITSTLPAIVP